MKEFYCNYRAFFSKKGLNNHTLYQIFMDINSISVYEFKNRDCNIFNISMNRFK